MARSRMLLAGPPSEEAPNITALVSANAAAINAANAMMTALRFAGPMPAANVDQKGAMRFLSVILQAGNDTTLGALVNPLVNSHALCGELRQEMACNTLPCPVDCEVSPVNARDPRNSPCSETCGAGVHAVLRKVTQIPSGGGRGCPSLEVEAPCNNGPCKPRTVTPTIPDSPVQDEVLDCKVSAWTDWSSCDGASYVSEAAAAYQAAINAGVPNPSRSVPSASSPFPSVSSGLSSIRKIMMALPRKQTAVPPTSASKQKTVRLAAVSKQATEEEASEDAEDVESSEDAESSENAEESESGEDTFFVELALESDLAQVGKVTPRYTVSASTGSGSCNSCAAQKQTCQQTCQQKAQSNTKFVPLSQLSGDTVVAGKSHSEKCRFKSCLKSNRAEETEEAEEGEDAAADDSEASEEGEETEAVEEESNQALESSDPKDTSFQNFAKQISTLFDVDDAATFEAAIESGNDHRFSSDQQSTLLTMTAADKAKLVAWARKHRHSKAATLKVKRLKSSATEEVTPDTKWPVPVRRKHRRRRPRFAALQEYEKEDLNEFSDDDLALAQIWEDAFIEIGDCMPTCAQLHESCSDKFCNAQNGLPTTSSLSGHVSLPFGKLYRAVSARLGQADEEGTILNDQPPSPTADQSGTGSAPVVPAPVSANADPCILATGGTQTRTRTVVIPSQNGGLGCPSLVESRTCNVYNTSNAKCVAALPAYLNAAPTARLAQSRIKEKALHELYPAYSPQFYSGAAAVGVKNPDPESILAAINKVEHEGLSANDDELNIKNAVKSSKKHVRANEIPDIDELASAELSALENAEAEEDQKTEKELHELAEAMGHRVMQSLLGVPGATSSGQQRPSRREPEQQETEQAPQQTDEQQEAELQQLAAQHELANADQLSRQEAAAQHLSQQQAEQQQQPAQAAPQQAEQQQPVAQAASQQQPAPQQQQQPVANAQSEDASTNARLAGRRTHNHESSSASSSSASALGFDVTPPPAQPEVHHVRYIIPQPLIAPEYKEKVAPTVTTIDPKKIVGENYLSTSSSDAGGVVYMAKLTPIVHRKNDAVITSSSKAALRERSASAPSESARRSSTESVRPYRRESSQYHGESVRRHQGESGRHIYTESGRHLYTESSRRHTESARRHTESTRRWSTEASHAHVTPEVVRATRGQEVKSFPPGNSEPAKPPVPFAPSVSKEPIGKETSPHRGERYQPYFSGSNTPKPDHETWGAKTPGPTEFYGAPKPSPLPQKHESSHSRHESSHSRHESSHPRHTEETWGVRSSSSQFTESVKPAPRFAIAEGGGIPVEAHSEPVEAELSDSYATEFLSTHERLQPSNVLQPEDS
jgi:hypothetical protein